MPVYEYHCEKCDHEVTLTLSISEHEKGPIKCPTWRQSVAAIAKRLRVSDIEEILTPNLGNEPHGRRGAPRRSCCV